MFSQGAVAKCPARVAASDLAYVGLRATGRSICHAPPRLHAEHFVFMLVLLVHCGPFEVSGAVVSLVPADVIDGYLLGGRGRGQEGYRYKPVDAIVSQLVVLGGEGDAEITSRHGWSHNLCLAAAAIASTSRSDERANTSEVTDFIPPFVTCDGFPVFSHVCLPSALEYTGNAKRVKGRDTAKTLLQENVSDWLIEHGVDFVRNKFLKDAATASS